MSADEETDLSNILTAIASVSPDASRDELVSTINLTVDSVITSIRALGEDETPAPDLLKATQVTLGFLEACGQMGNKKFQGHIKDRAGELRMELMLKAGRSADIVAPPEPLFNNFEDAFAGYFCLYIRAILSEFHLQSAEPIKPYMLNPDFADVLVDAINTHVLPDILYHRRIRSLSDSVNESNLNRDFFFKEFSKPEEENVVQLLWVGVMSDFSEALVSVTEAAKPKYEKSKKKKISLFNMKKEDKAKKPKGSKPDNRFAKAEAFWKMLQSGADAHGFDAPKVADFDLFQSLMNYDLEQIAESKLGIRQLLEQENSTDARDAAREGATRDWIYRLIERLPPHCGELLVLWAYSTYDELFTAAMLRSVIVGMGTTDVVRKRAVPMLWRWAE
ncbi:MAG: hypothetical protein HQ503_07290, partial [Rhodospirillales bacterium]|nr:hypothetical protein [Rhodospirillales bacterium]